MVEQIDISNPKSITLEVEVKTGITIRETIKIGTDQIAETEDNTDKIEVGLDKKNYRRGNFRGNIRSYGR